MTGSAMKQARLVVSTGTASPDQTPLARAPWWTLVKTAGSSWVADYAPSMGAALSYYSVFSLAPVLLLVISIAGLVFGEDAVRGEVSAQLGGLMGQDAAKTIESVLVSASLNPAAGMLSTAIGVVMLLIGATTVFGELQDALDRIWRAPVRDRRGGLWSLLRSRLLSFGMVLGIAFLLMVSLVMSAAVSALGKWWAGAFGSWELLAQLLNVAVGFALTTGVFAMIYKLMPRVKVQWRDVWIGATVTAFLFTIGRFLIGLYIGKSGIASTFGAAGSLVVVFVWVYYSAQIFLIGAEFTWVYAKTFGSMQEAAQEQAPKTASMLPNAGSSVGTAVTSSASPRLPDAPTTYPTAAVPVKRPRLSPVKRAAYSLAVTLVFHYVVPKLLRRRRSGVERRKRPPVSSATARNLGVFEAATATALRRWTANHPGHAKP